MSRESATSPGHGFQAAQDDAYLALCIQRARESYLTWVEQFLDLLEERGVDKGTLNDIGCNLGQFWKGLKRRGLALDYRGFDVEPIYARHAVEIFPELAGRLHVHDVVAATPPPADVTVTSATLEHLPALQPALDRLLESTSKLIIVRSFLGDEPLMQPYRKPKAEIGYPVHQYAFDEIVERMHAAGFATRLVKDRHTRSEPVEIAPDIVRTQWIVLGERRP